MIKTYRCIETFYLDECDDNGFPTDKQFAIVKGSRWQEDTDCKERMVGGSDTVRLDRLAPKKCQWIEITKERLEEFFELLN